MSQVAHFPFSVRTLPLHLLQSTLGIVRFESLKGQRKGTRIANSGLSQSNRRIKNFLDTKAILLKVCRIVSYRQSRDASPGDLVQIHMHWAIMLKDTCACCVLQLRVQDQRICVSSWQNYQTRNAVTTHDSTQTSMRRSQHDPKQLYLDSVLGHFYQLITQMHSGYLLDSIKCKGNKGATDAMDVMICTALSKIYRKFDLAISHRVSLSGNKVMPQEGAYHKVTTTRNKSHNFPHLPKGDCPPSLVALLRDMVQSELFVQIVE
ncbi:hypothetical protein BDR06DRAFT_971649 [Suillus hirtellus]|nr:hypothetical protein BDR06DRAFT_971649 [Suillus hirtellus]